MAMEKYHYRPKGAKTKADEIVLPFAKDALSAGFIRKNRKGADAEELGWRMIEAVADEKTLAKIDDLTIEEFRTFMTEWQGEGSPNVGES